MTNSPRPANADLVSYKKRVADVSRQIHDDFFNHTNVAELVHRRSDEIDKIIVDVWLNHIDPDQEITLVAVGGYGRGELHPYSDIDILILLSNSYQGEADAQLEAFITFLWDIGLKVGHSIRTINECYQQARDDITIMTNLLEARPLVGSAQLFSQLNEEIATDRIWPAREYFSEKLKEQEMRHDKYDDAAFVVEPNVKEGLGGLRDLQMIVWVTQRFYQISDLHELVKKGFLTEEEYRSLNACKNFLWAVRMALHLLAERNEERILFDYQPRLAEIFGYSDDNKELAVESLMKKYYRNLKELERLNEMLLQLFKEEILYKDEPSDPEPINERFQSIKGFIETTSSAVFEQTPSALLEIFIILAGNPQLKGVRAGTLRQIRAAIPLIDDEFRDNEVCKQLFMDIFRMPRGLTHVLRQMHKYGILGAYLPAFGQIEGLMQYDLFHIYTVDDHTLMVIRNLRRLTVKQHQDEFPELSQLLNKTPKPEILYLAALFHDIAKGRGGDHSSLGATESYDFCKQHGMSEYDSHLVAWLVRNHLVMSLTAQRKDISDPGVIADFAKEVKDIAHLNYLYLLTIADMRATNPNLWNFWKQALLSDLYNATKQALRRGLDTSVVYTDIIENTKNDARTMLGKEGYSMLDIEAVWQYCPDDYFIRYSSDDIALHMRNILSHEDMDEPLIVIYEPRDYGGMAIFIYTRARDALFADITSGLDQLGLDIADARIIPASNGMTLDTYIVIDDEHIENRQNRAAEIHNLLYRQITSPDDDASRIKRRLTRHQKHFQSNTRVSFFPNDTHRTVIIITTSDRPGILANIGLVLHKHHVVILNAKIATMGSKVEDIFFVTDKDGNRINKEDQRQLEKDIIAALDA
jgi:[protein-PII] uridylyltransferase